MKLKDLIKNENFDYIEFRETVLDDDGKTSICLFAGACKSIDGKLISLDRDNYSEEMEIIEYNLHNSKKSSTFVGFLWTMRNEK